MNKLTLFLSCMMITMLPMSASAGVGGGHIDSPATAMLSESNQREIVVTNSVLTPEEILILDLARRFVLSQFGEEARSWPITADVQSQTFSILNKNTGAWESHSTKRN